MTEAHRRKKQPEQVRQQLLEVAARLSHEQGVAGITLDAVSQAAGVSKGGLLHHFPNKLALLDGLFDDLVTRFDREIEAAMARDPVAKGRFTRAYIDVCFALDPATDVPGWRMLTIALIAEPHLKSAGATGSAGVQWSSRKRTVRPAACLPALPVTGCGSRI